MSAPHTLGVADAARAIRERALSSVDLVRTALRRIDDYEPRLRAWVIVDRDGALAQARQLDSTPPDERGPLHGVPIGVKDIFDVAGLPTAAGFGPFARRPAAADSTAVARLRAAGAVILGKTVTTQFAYMDPPPTRNPWSDDRTPGGSSSGSAAAVAVRMVPAALGSQTGGSVLRPAAYCGVVGLKPTFGRISRHGVLPLAWSIDHPGVIARSVEDCALIYRAIAGHDPADPGSSSRPLPAAGIESLGARAPRLIVLDDFLERAQPAARLRFEETLAVLVEQGAVVRRTRFPGGAATLISTHAVLMQAEAAAVHEGMLVGQSEHYGPRIRSYVENGALISALDYLGAQRLRRRFRSEATSLLAQGDVLCLPTVSGPAPSPETTGDPTFQSPFSLLGLPSISLPSGNDEGMPLGLQLVGEGFAEEVLIEAASWAERRLPPAPPPPAYP